MQYSSLSVLKRCLYQWKLWILLYLNEMNDYFAKKYCHLSLVILYNNENLNSRQIWYWFIGHLQRLKTIFCKVALAYGGGFLKKRLVKGRIPDQSTGPYPQITKNRNRHARDPVQDHPICYMYTFIHFNW